MSTITKIYARWVADSRGNPTTEVELTTDKGMFRAICPSGASTGIYEALELRDGGDRFLGKGVQKAVDHINNDIAPAMIGMDIMDQAVIDKKLCELDGTPNKENFGANAILPVSMAVCMAAAANKGLPLHTYIAEIAGTEKQTMPVPCFNVINGGSHAGNALAMQEFMIAPVGAKTFQEAYMMAMETYQHLKSLIKKEYGIDAVNVGDEGGFAPGVTDNEAPLKLIVAAIEKAGYTGKIKICMDSAAAEFYENGQYNLNFKGETPQIVSGQELANIYAGFVEKYPIISIEDPFDQDDFESYASLRKMLEGKCQVVGDDLLVTNVKRIQMAEEKKACNALLLKVNQIGSVTEAINAVKMAYGNGWTVMTSHRSGETEDVFIAHLVVGLATSQIKTGSPCRGERTAKYNELLRIEDRNPTYPYGWKFPAGF